MLWVHVEESAIPCKKISGKTLEERIATLDALSDRELLAKLDDTTIVSHGYSVQELALALLRLRDYQVEDPLRSFGKWPQPLSSLSWSGKDGSSREVFLFSSISSEEIQAVSDFLSKSQVPFTPCGIVERLVPENRELFVLALVRTDEWARFIKLFPDFSEDQCVDIAQELGGKGFLSAIEENGQERSERLLSLFEKYSSKHLAEYLAAECPDCIVARGSDESVLRVLCSLPMQSDGGLRLSIRLLQAPRKSIVWKAAQAFLARALNRADIAKVSKEELFDALKQFIGMKREVVTTQKKEDKPSKPVPSTPLSEISTRAATRQLTPYKTYVVKKGDTLWSVAKRFNVHVEKLKYLNGLKGTKLSPGITLRIPH